MEKKGMIQSQIFIFLLGIIVIGMTVLIGYKVIGSFSKGVSSQAIKDFKMDLEVKTSDVANEYGTLKKETIRLPSKVKAVCIANSNINGNDVPEIPIVKPDDFIITSDDIGARAYNGIKSSLENGVEANVFIITDRLEEPFYIEHVKVDETNTVSCLKNNGGLNIILEGFGNHVLLSGECKNDLDCFLSCIDKKCEV